MKKEAFQHQLLSWYAINKRDLPWRKTTNSYKILVSEIMLQQTQVNRVIDYYKRFLKQFPTVEVLANAKTAAVIKAWAGLGYNRRAVLLQKCAQAIQGKRFPKTPEALEDLPGIGPYTAAAVASFAHNRDVGVVDTNVIRVLSRLFYGVENAKKEEITTLAQEIVPKKKSRIWNNAIMDFGAMICASIPQCSSCPFAKQCPALKNGFPQGQSKAKQPAFEGSTRQVRGQIIAILRKTHSISVAELARKLQKPASKVQLVTKKLATDGLAVIKKKTISLP